MAHVNWCGEDCSTCGGCELERNMPCFPHCEGFVGDEVFDIGCIRCDSFSSYIDSAIENSEGCDPNHEDVINQLSEMCSETVSLADLKVAVCLA